MIFDLDYNDIITRPVTILTAVLGIAGGVLKLPVIGAVWAVIWGNIGTIFGVVSVVAAQIAPRVAWLPTETFTAAAFVTAILFVLHGLDRVADRLRQRLTDSEEPT